MSTIYELLSTEDGHVDLTEHSNKFDLDVGVGKIEPHWMSIDDLTLDQIKHINQQLTNVISYFDPDYNGCDVNY